MDHKAIIGLLEYTSLDAMSLIFNEAVSNNDWHRAKGLRIKILAEAKRVAGMGVEEYAREQKT